ncbi:hypothetical protein VTH82DRAFT_1606 [Thermothelomyces myriococcoides]
MMQAKGSTGPPLRSLLPRPPTSQGGTDGCRATPVVPRRAHTRVACERCHHRKIKCDGRRPICSACAASNVNRCSYLSADPEESRSSAIKRKYEETQDRLSSYEQLYSLLRTRSQAEVAEILRRIRTGKTVDEVLRSVKDGDLLLQLRLFPETRLRYTFPDFASWPTVFRDPTDPYLRTQLLDFPATPDSRAGGGRSASARTSGTATPSPLPPDPASCAYQIPYHAARLVDPRISSVKASKWTSVTSDDSLVSKLLSIYFQFDYTRSRCFHKDLFLDDLVHGATDFCSPLLVNCVLANAAHGLVSDPNRVEFWAPRSLPYAFMAEARRLWDIETAGEPRLTTIHAALCLIVRYGADGSDKIAVPFVIKALELANRMELFTRREKGNSRMSIARAYTAWAVFGYHGLVFYYMHKEPWITKPPATPLPDYSSIRNFTGEVYLQYPIQPNPTPAHFGASFLAQIGLNTIMLEINKAASSAGSPGTAPPTLAQAIQLYKKLNDWHKALLDVLQPSKIVMPHHLQIHMEYCLVLINLFEPWMSGPDADTAVPIDSDNEEKWKEYQERGTTVREIGMRARARLETLVRLYYLRHSFDALDVILVMFLLLLGSISARTLTPPPNRGQERERRQQGRRLLGDSGGHAACEEEEEKEKEQEQSQKDEEKARDRGEQNEDEEDRSRAASTFLLCAKGLRDQARNQYLGTLMFAALTALADPADAAVTGALARIRAESPGSAADDVRPEHVHMDWPVYPWIDPPQPQPRERPR